jgi:hypothetical protein
MMFKVHPMLRRLLVLVLIFAASGVWAQRVLTTPDFTGFSKSDGATNLSVTMLPILGGGFLLRGNFEVWYDGIRFRDWLKLKANGEPDTSWRLELSQRIPNPWLQVATTPYGVMIAGYLESANGVAVTPYGSVNKDYGSQGIVLVPWDSARAARSPQIPTAGPGGIDAVGVLSNYDALTDYVYVDTLGGIQRISAKSGDFDPSWRSPPYVGGKSSLLADSVGGLWMASSGYDGSLRAAYPDGYSFDGWRISEALRSEPWKAFTASYAGDAMGFAGGYVYTQSARFRLSDGSLGASLPLPSNRYVSLVNNDHIYFVSNPKSATGTTSISRVSTTASSADDFGFPIPETWSFDIPAGYAPLPLGPVDRATAARSMRFWPTPGEPGNIAVMTSKRGPIPVDGLPPASGGPNVLIVKEDLVGMEDPNVVEYYVPAAKRYFITGRKSEQALLDDPDVRGAFIRTGMRFTAKSSRYRDVPELPVCRLYAAPEKGGSNSHFYGMGDDCPTLNKLKGLKYEGFDFSVFKPGFGGCPADAPNAVSRLFNNKAASNDGNHRYVVSAATQSKMLTQGWVDEGVVFCSTSVVDATD